VTTESPPIESRDELVQAFAAGSKSPEEWRVGLELEKAGVDPETAEALPFGGPAGIEATLRSMAELHGWEPVVEEGRVIGLGRAGAAITLEPGGQTELASLPAADLHAMAVGFASHRDEIRQVADRLGVAFLGIGIQPVTPLESIDWMPKGRYAVMAPYLRTRGTLSHAMMKQTIGIQCTFDYADEPDCFSKIRLAMGLSPIATALFAHSPLSGGTLNGYKSFRAHIWTQTDPDRCGLLRGVFEEDFGFEAYTDWCLAVPAMFIVRGGRWVPLGGMPFGRFLEEGFEGHRATLSDWDLHLTTIFTEARLKTFIEIRCADSLRPDDVLAVPAFWKGLLYDAEASAAAWETVADWKFDERLALWHEAPRSGLAAKTPDGRTVLEVARELLAISLEGLARQSVSNGQGRAETIWLEPYAERIIATGRGPADELAALWAGEWSGDPRSLVAWCRY
jgi:glutamate--cysteine ligase